MYAEDSFFTLTFAGRVGLTLLSTVMTIIVGWFIWRFSGGRSLMLRLAIAGLAYFGFIWLAPQVYYTYYIYLFDDLPWQLVVHAPPSPLDLIALMLFQENHNLSFHAQGLLGWLFLALALFNRGQADSK